MKELLYIGFMSGTSCDGLDASLARTDGENIFHAVDNLHVPYSKELRLDIHNLFTDIKIRDLLEIERKITQIHIEATKILLDKNNYLPKDIKALGFHGQTIFHDPQNQNTVQIGNPHMLAQSTRINVIHDFRRRDLSLGGQGAPLVPIFHKLLVLHYKFPIAIINIGGVANLTYIDNAKDILIAFDTGPGNALIDDAMLKYFSRRYDDGGKVASTGKVDYKVAGEFLHNKYFSSPYPKSLDRNAFYFIYDILKFHSPEDIVSTLTYITSLSLVHSIKLLPEIPKKILLCGGGSKNIQLVDWFSTELLRNNINCKVEEISTIKGLDPDYIESQAFAYLTARFFKKLPSAFPSTTCAIKQNICGCLVKK